MSATPISPLRQGLIEDMMARSFIARFRDAGLSHCLADAPPASATLRHVGLRCISRELWTNGKRAVARRMTIHHATADNVQRFTLAGAAHGPLDGDPNSWDPRR
jgi:hypothetical protein